jgi:hypothetical protein
MNNEKLEKLIEKMLSDQDKIANVKRGDPSEFNGPITEYYFTFPDQKYHWSITSDPSGEHLIFYYPSETDTSTFLRFGRRELSNWAQENLAKLFEVVNLKVFAFDDVLNQILKEE